MRLLHAELLKVRTAPRTTIALVLGLLLIVALGSASTASSDGSGPFATETAVSDVLEIASTAAFFALILGILVVTWEYRHGTITPTFLITPRREQVLGTKAVVASALGAALMLLAIAVSLALALIWIDVELGGDQWEQIARLLFGALAWAVLGVGVGAALQSQVGAIILAFVWFMIAEPLIGAGLDELGLGVSDYLPGSALGRLFETPTSTGEEFAPDDEALSTWGAAALVGAYALVAAVVGAVLAERRDVS